MTHRSEARNDRIATRYMFGEKTATLARDYGVCRTRVHQIIRGHLEHSRRKFRDRFGEWPDDLTCNAVRPRLLHLMNQYRVRTGLAPFSPAVLMTISASHTQPKREKALVCSQSDARGRQDVEGAAKRLDSPERRALPKALA